MLQEAKIQKKAFGGGLLLAALIAAVCAFAGLATPAQAREFPSWDDIVSELNEKGSYTLDPDVISMPAAKSPLYIEEGKTATLTLTRGNFSLSGQPIVIAPGASLTLTAQDSNTQATLSNISGITLSPGTRAGQSGASLTVDNQLSLDLRNMTQLIIPSGTQDAGTGCSLTFNDLGYVWMGDCNITVQANGTAAPGSMTLLAAQKYTIANGPQINGTGSLTVQGGADEAHNAQLTLNGNLDSRTVNLNLRIFSQGQTTITDSDLMGGLTVTGGLTEYSSGMYYSTKDPLKVTGGTFVIGNEENADIFIDMTDMEVTGGNVIVLSDHCAGTFLEGCKLGAKTVLCEIYFRRVMDDGIPDSINYVAYPQAKFLQDYIYELSEYYENPSDPFFGYNEFTVLDGPAGTVITRPDNVVVTSKTSSVTVVNAGEPVPMPGDASDVQEAVAAAKGSIVSGMADYANVTTSDGNTTWTIAVKDDADPASDVANDLLSPFVTALVDSKALTATSVQNSSVTLSLPNATTEAQNTFIEGVLANAAPMPKAATAAAPSITELVGKTCGVKVTCADETTLSYTFNFTEEVAEPAPPATEPSPVPIYRLYNPDAGQHLYTSDTNEVSYLTARGWTADFSGKPCWHAPAPGSPSASYPIMRLYNPNNGDHYFVKASDSHQIDFLLGKGWQKEGDCAFWSAAEDAENVEIHTLYNPNASEDTYLYTSQISEVNYLTTHGWEAQGAIIYGVTSAQ